MRLIVAVLTLCFSYSALAECTQLEEAENKMIEILNADHIDGHKAMHISIGSRKIRLNQNGETVCGYEIVYYFTEKNVETGEERNFIGASVFDDDLNSLRSHTAMGARKL